MLLFQNISKSYGTFAVLRGATLSCERGEALCLAGANAAGKTTLLTIGAGLQKPQRGEVQRDGGIGYVSQENALLSDLTVRDNLALWYAAAERPAGKMFAPGSPEGELGLEPFARKRVSALSGGIKKRAAVACALAGDPDYLLMDEPFTALDHAGREEMAAMLCGLKKRGKGILFSSHDPAAIAMVADRLAILRDGVIEESRPLPQAGKQNREAFLLELLAQT